MAILQVNDVRTVDSQGSPKTPSLRAVLIGFILLPLNIYWIITAEIRFRIQLTVNPLFTAPIFFLFLLIGLNILLRRKWPRYALRPTELVTIYVMLVMSCTLASIEFIGGLFSSMALPRWFASPENNWENSIFPHLPRWLHVWDKGLLEGFFKGHRSLYDASVLRMWMVPLGFWTIFIFAAWWITLCFAILIRKAWMEESRLTFPVVRLPMVMTEEPQWNSTLRSRVLWMGFAVAAAIEVLNGFHGYFPNLPHLEVAARRSIISLPAPLAPVNLPFSNYPFAIGLAFLVPLDVSFSCWFFYLLVQFMSQSVLPPMYGGNTGYQFAAGQSIGAWAAFGFSLLYMYRRYLKRIFRISLQAKSREDAGEPMRYRYAFLGLSLGVLVFVLFWWAAGMSLGWAVVVVGGYLLLALGITRVRAEAGGQHTVWDLEPMNLFQLFNASMLGPRNLAGAAVNHWYWTFNRSHPMPSQLEAFQLARAHNMNLGGLVAPMVGALALTTVGGMWAFLHISYKYGALEGCQYFPTWVAIGSSNWLDSALSTGFQNTLPRWEGLLGGAGFVTLLYWLRARFSGFPFHPLGYCFGPNLHWIWSAFLIAWIVKLPILRYGGLRLYRKSLPFFLGLILGDYVMGSLWSFVGIIFHVPVYQMF